MYKTFEFNFNLLLKYPVSRELSCKLGNMFSGRLIFQAHPVLLV